MLPSCQNSSISLVSQGENTSDLFLPAACSEVGRWNAPPHNASFVGAFEMRTVGQVPPRSGRTCRLLFKNMSWSRTICHFQKGTVPNVTVFIASSLRAFAHNGPLGDASAAALSSPELDEGEKLARVARRYEIRQHIELAICDVARRLGGARDPASDLPSEPAFTSDVSPYRVERSCAATDGCPSYTGCLA